MIVWLSLVGNKQYISWQTSNTTYFSSIAPVNKHYSLFQITICLLWRQTPLIKDVFHSAIYTVDHLLSSVQSHAILRLHTHATSGFHKKSFTLEGGARHQFINREQQGTPSPALYSRIMRVILAQSASMVAHSIHVVMNLYVVILNV